MALCFCQLPEACNLEGIEYVRELAFISTQDRVAYQNLLANMELFICDDKMMSNKWNYLSRY